MSRTRMELTTIAALAMCALAWQPSPTWAQTRPSVTATAEPPDAQHTKDELNALLEHYPPRCTTCWRSTPSLLGNESYLAPYPALVSFLNAHPEIARNPAFYMGEHLPQDRTSQTADMWRDVVNGLGIFAGFGMAIGLLVWLIRTLVDYRQWNRFRKSRPTYTPSCSTVLRLTTICWPIFNRRRSRFLNRRPSRWMPRHAAVGAPLGRILWSVQGGVVLLAGGIGMMIVSRTGDGCDATTIARRAGHYGHRAGPGVRDIGDNLFCDLAAAGFD